jgi:4-alpha-glucanotransferase
LSTKKDIVLTRKAPVVISKKPAEQNITEDAPPQIQPDTILTPNSKTVTKPVSKKTKKPTAKKKQAATPNASVKIHFFLRYHTEFGQSIYITAANEKFGNGDHPSAFPLSFLNEEQWHGTIELAAEDIAKPLTYNYVIKQADGSFIQDWGNDKKIVPQYFNYKEVQLVDSWNHAGFPENVFYTEPFQNVLLSDHSIAHKKVTTVKSFTHLFRAKAPLLAKNEVLCLVGNDKQLKEWNEAAPILMDKPDNEDHWQVAVNLLNAGFPLVYKYGVYNVKEKAFVRFEQGNNRILYDAVAKQKLSVVNDGFVQLPSDTWKGGGIAIPVFSLRSEKSLGIGEFHDLKLLVDWARETGLKLIQILPVNDTTATHTWTDSYPYAAVSAFALNPVYIHIDKIIDRTNKSLILSLKEKRKALNSLPVVDYDAVLNYKFELLRDAFEIQKKTVFNLKSYKDFFENNSHWLVPYAAFCYFRDKYKTPNFALWPEHATFDTAAVEAMSQPGSILYDELSFHYFVQYHLHLQLKDAANYAHEHSVILKGDIAIGIYRYSVDAWQQPELYHMDVQAGAPPDDFAVKGQNWGFPTYNWERMQENDFDWWKKRFQQMNYYFDAFRIDHILGFFRIWSIPMHAVEGIMGYFVPAQPVHISEFHQENIQFDYNRFCKPFITNHILWETFNDQQDHVKETFLNYDGFEKYNLIEEFNTQRKVEAYFSKLPGNEKNTNLKNGLYSLISNVILFEVEGSQQQQFHFRFSVESTSSFQNFDAHTQHLLKQLYVNYFFKRQDDPWMKEALKKLPALKRATNMLVCGEDLGLVPACVPQVMKDLGMLSLEIQRMPKDATRTFFHPSDAPYLSVVTPSTHDMSTIRSWWEEDRAKTQRFYNHELGQWGDAPFFCEPWIAHAILLQHMHSPAMWSVFQLQDLLAMDANVRRDDPYEERINDPSNPKHYWRYRMHLDLEELLEAHALNKEIHSMLKSSGRI